MACLQPRNPTSRLNPSMRRIAVRRFRRGVRRFIILENSGKLAEESLLLLWIFLNAGILAVGSLGLARLDWHRLVAPAEQFGEESGHARALVAGIVRLGPRHKRRHVIIGTGGGSQA